MNDKLIQDDKYEGYDLLPNWKPFSKRILDRILLLFDYANNTKNFQGRLVRFDFDSTASTKDILYFFERLRKYHKYQKKHFLYLCVREESKSNEIHHHSFVIVNYKDYGTRRMVFNVLNKFWDKKRPAVVSPIWPSHKHKLERFKNFYSITKDYRGAKDRNRAFEAASYLAKTIQTPASLPKNSRNMMSSKIKI